MAVPLVALAGASAAAPPDPVAEALRACLTSPGHPFDEAAQPSEAPPGLAERQAKAIRLGARPGGAYAYAGLRSDMITCGIALYGPVSAAQRRTLRTVIEQSSPRLRPAPSTLYRAEAPGAKASYWGAIRAPDLAGVLMLERAPRKDAPTVDVEYHAILVR
jgi:hypothetical protein